jgi:hypothetical protein
VLASRLCGNHTSEITYAIVSNLTTLFPCFGDLGLASFLALPVLSALNPLSVYYQATALANPSVLPIPLARRPIEDKGLQTS